MNLSTLTRRYLSDNAGLRKPGTMHHYHAALDAFTEFSPHFPTDARAQTSLLLDFVRFLSEAGYKSSTVRVYATDAKLFLEWCVQYDHLSFNVQKTKTELATLFTRSTRFRQKNTPPVPVEGIEKLLTYHMAQPPPVGVSEARLKRWELERQRNAALIHCLADSGGRISEVLSLRASDFPELAGVTALRREYWKVSVTGKQEHEYKLWLCGAVNFVLQYLEERGVDAAKRVPVFVRHGGQYAGESLAGNALTRQAALYLVSKAAQAVGIPKVTPHDFRHWRATQLESEGVPRDEARIERKLRQIE
ncbi:MAG: tyrosine-type recombinase/integrase [Planctomycetota bacterium]|jgi:integrase